jgi:hypothetical protein
VLISNKKCYAVVFASVRAKYFNDSSINHQRMSDQI